MQDFQNLLEAPARHAARLFSTALQMIRAALRSERRDRERRRWMNG